MTTKEALIEAIMREIDRLNEEDLDEVYILIKRFIESKERDNKPSFLSKLREIQIDGPEDLAENLDLYLSGEKKWEDDRNTERGNR